MKKRLDMLLVEQGLSESREKAKAVIMSGCVYVNGQKEDKVGVAFAEEGLKLEVRGNTLKYVSRGGLKLEKAVELWNLPLEGSICMDIGASTGGFTDCMLQNGAKCVYAVDVGTAQLAQRLKNDSRVYSFEQTNITEFYPEEKADFIAADVSFVSLEKIFPEADRLLAFDGTAVVLIKPQFEAGRENIGKNGIVRDRKIHKNIITRLAAAASVCGLYCAGIEVSPIKGGDGNTEYLMLLAREQIPFDIRKAAENAVSDKNER